MFHDSKQPQASSSKSTATSSSKSKEKNNLSLAQMLPLIKAHIEFLVDHKIYLEKMIAGQVSKADYDAYFVEIFGFTIDPRESLLSDLVYVTNNKIRLYEKLLEIMKPLETPDLVTQDEKVKIACALKLIFKFFSKDILQPIALSGVPNNKIAKILKPFNDSAFMEPLLPQLDKYIPKDHYSAIESIIKFHKIDLNKNTHSNKATNFTNICFKPELRWTQYFQRRNAEVHAIFRKTMTAEEYAEEYAKMQKESQLNPDFGKTVFSEVNQVIEEHENAYRQTLRQIQATNELTTQPPAKIRFEAESAYHLKSYMNVKDMTENRELELKAHPITYFHEFIPFVKKNVDDYFYADKVFDKYVAFNVQHETIRKNTDIMCEKEEQAKILLTKLEKSVDNALRLAKTDNIKEQAQHLLSQLDEIKKHVSEMKANWEDSLPESIDASINIADIKYCYHLLTEQAKMLEKQLDKIKSELTQLLRDFQAKKSGKDNETVTKLDFVTEDKKAQALATAHYFEEVQAKTATWKDKVAKMRKLKEEQAAKDKIIPTPIEEPAAITYIDVSMKELILNLSDKHFARLRAIVHKIPGIEFKQVVNLIRKHLNGQVEEIGNGSSHKCITLNKLIKEVHINEENTSDLVKHSICRSHGKQHTVRKLSPFYLDLLNIVFENAGITKEILAEFEKEREALKEKRRIEGLIR